ncbi:LTA synthase family protein [Faecalicatena sp. Marseille-Q4148]|nr:LTA synthase family protein [Faecalicatena sp. Marseille-Q4148]
MLERIWKAIRRIFGPFFTLIMLIGLFLGVVSYYLAQWVIDTWGLLTMDEIVFHLKVPLEGTNEDMVWEAVNLCVPVAIVAVLTLLIVWIAVRKRKITKYLVWIGVMSFAVFLVKHSVDYIWEELSVDDYLKSQKTQSTFIQDNYVDPRSVQITFPEQKRNLIYIFLESMETTYASKEVGGAFDQNCIPELTALAQSNISFSNTQGLGGGYAATGATWTMGAMFAQTSGLPLSIPIDGNAMDTQASFLPAVSSIGDILEEQGYRQTLLIGSDASFGGRRNYFSSHGNYEMLDFNEAAAKGLIPPGYKVFWGYEDQRLFEIAKQKLTELSASPEPFNLTMLTVDTHFEDGYTCELCRNDYPTVYQNVMACSSRQVAEFVSWIQQQPFYANTTIVISGDHLTMKNLETDFMKMIPEDYSRRVYNAFINSAAVPANLMNREFTTMDMFPTTLASLGVTIEGDRLALGTNLFASIPTRTEEVGIEMEEKELQRNSSFWDNFTRDIE